MKAEEYDTDHLDSDRDSFVSGAVKQEMGSDEEMMEELVGRDVTLPSNKDSKLWRL